MLARWLVLIVPCGLTALGWRLVRPQGRVAGAALLGAAAAAVGLAGLNVVAASVGWWTFEPVSGSALGMPVDAWLGWSLLWGAVPVLLRVPVPLLLLAWLWLDLLAVPRLGPLLRVGPQWMVGELLGLALVALPVVLLGRWVADERHLKARAGLQFVAFAGLTGWLLPAIAIEQGDGAWRHLTGLPRWQLSLVVQAVAVVALPGVLAVREFVERGGGTPYPWDPPRRLVTTGPYAYLANPMQASAVAVLLVVAAATHSWTTAGVAVSAAGFAIGVAGPHEDRELTRRHGAAWSAYRAGVRAWWPRWRPAAPPARLHLAAQCDLCSSAALALARLEPLGLALCPAPRHLRRARYEGGDDYTADGVAALARGLEHVNLGWAVVGWAMRVPGLDRLLQLVVDGAGGGPRELGPVRGSAPWSTPDRS